ncbi:MAG: DNA ligase D [Phycisphaerales bacterium]|nr:DNA ligase D [Phycisphaerales bacterium]
MSLRAYARKRDFTKTREPAPRASLPKAKPQRRSRGGRAASAPPSALRFVIQKHDASRLHYDLRLELDGVLKSWAVPKGPSLNPADKRLAVQVEDHPLDYADFEGTIPKGQYGGGTVLLWDEGRWTPLDSDPDKALRSGRLKFGLSGRKLHGAWTLTRLRGNDESGDRVNWLLIKSRDEAASTTAAITEDEPLSVRTGRSLDDIAGPSSRRTRAPRKRAPKLNAGDIAGARKRSMASVYRPQLCTPSDTIPGGAGWVHEVKFDGYRLLARRTPAGVRIITRGGKDWTSKFGPIAEAMAALDVDSAVIDGEAAIMDAAGRSSFQALQKAIKHGDYGRLTFHVFDLLYCDGFDLTSSPLLARKALLHRIIPANGSTLRYSDHVEADGSTVQRDACRLGLEGIISKRGDAPYVQARSPSWVKFKCGLRQEFIIVGYTGPTGGRRHFGSLLLAAHDGEDRLVYAGRVGTGFDEESLADIAARLKPLARDDSGLDVGPSRAEARGVRWVEPRLVAEVALSQWTADARLRHPTFHGLREDKPPSSVRFEVAPPASPAVAGERSPARRARKSGADVAGISISNPDRILFPDDGITKLDLVRYHEQVGEFILPHVVGRPLSTLRCPTGLRSTCFFQKHLGTTLAEPVRPMRIAEKDGPAEYISIDDLAGLITLVQFGVVEIHPWGSRSVDVEHPDRLTFDLDPGDGVAFGEVKSAARRIRDVLTVVKLRSFVKTSGGKGLHVVVPLRPVSGWEAARAFTAAVARRMAEDEPGRYTATMSKSKRAGRIFIDYLRNGRGATSVAAYSPRARPGAPVSMPVSWDDLARLKHPAQFTVKNAVAHIARRKQDPWRELAGLRQSLPR